MCCVCVCVCVCVWVLVLYVCADVCSFALDLGTMLFLNPLCLCVVCVVHMYVCACVCVCVCCTFFAASSCTLEIFPLSAPDHMHYPLPQTTCITLCPERMCVLLCRPSPPPPPPLTHEEGLLSGCCAWI